MHKDTYPRLKAFEPEGANPFVVDTISKVSIVAASLTEKIINPELALETDKLPKFGDEESYWTIYRMFCAGDRAGAAIMTVEEVWAILEKCYDMSEETPRSLEETLIMFASDIQADAKERGLNGRFCELSPGSFVFALHPSQIKLSPAKKLSDPKQSTSARHNTPAPKIDHQQEATQVAGTDASVKIHETSHNEFHEVQSWIKDVLYQEGKHGTRQPVLRKLMMQEFSGLDDDQTLYIIDQMVAAEELFKYSPQQAGAKWLTLDPAITQSNGNLTTKEVVALDSQTPESDLVKSELVFAILQFLLSEHTHANQRTSSGKLLQRLKEDYGIASDKATLNTTLRRLSAAELLSLDQGSPVAGRRKQMSKGKSQNVMRASIANQEVKELLREAKGVSEFRDIVSRHLEKLGVSLDDAPLTPNRPR